jgi:predicted RNA-binding Zn-ribbon protein involved in translation (DUF1610 family)
MNTPIEKISEPSLKSAVETCTKRAGRSRALYPGVAPFTVCSPRTSTEENNMYVMTLDVKSTHIRNPECPSRIAQQPNGSWMCVDCGLPILHKRINTDEPPEGPDDDIPIHVSRTDTQIHVEIDESGLEQFDGIKMCKVCGLLMVESMTHLYYYCPTCGLSVPKERRKEARTVRVGKRYG